MKNATVVSLLIFTVRSHGDAFTNVLRMYHGLSRFLKSWTIGTKDRDSVTKALTISRN